MGLREWTAGRVLKLATPSEANLIFWGLGRLVFFLVILTYFLLIIFFFSFFFQPCGVPCGVLS